MFNLDSHGFLSGEGVLEHVMKIIPLEEKWMEFYELPFMIADLFPYTVIKYQICSIF